MSFVHRLTNQIFIEARPELRHCEVSVLEYVVQDLFWNSRCTVRELDDHAPTLFFSKGYAGVTDAVDFETEVFNEDIQSIFGFGNSHAVISCGYFNGNAERQRVVLFWHTTNLRWFCTFQDFVIRLYRFNHALQGLIKSFSMRRDRQLGAKSPPAIAIFFRSPIESLNHRCWILSCA